MKNLNITLLLLSLVCASSAYSQVISIAIPLLVPSDPRADYTLLEFEQVSTHIIEIVTMRDGPSGISYAKREIDCNRMMFRYISEGDSLSDLREREATYRTLDFARLTDQSISYYVSRQACGGVLSVK